MNFKLNVTKSARLNTCSLQKLEKNNKASFLYIPQLWEMEQKTINAAFLSLVRTSLGVEPIVPGMSKASEWKIYCNTVMNERRFS